MINMLFDGIVRDFFGGESGRVVSNRRVYEIVLGGSPVEIGFVKDGIAYMPRFGGDPVQIGFVERY